VLISVDTLRADAVGAYGGAAATPGLDRLARDGVVFEHAFAPTPTTAPSHATLFTGLDVLRHGVLRNGNALPPEIPTIAEAFRSRGYATAAFVSSFVLDPRFGWNHGFEHYDADLSKSGATMKGRPYPGAFWAAERFEGFDRRAAATSRAVREWLGTARRPFFAFVHYFDPHAPYVPPDVYGQRVASMPVSLKGRAISGVPPGNLQQLVRLYQGEVLYVDAEIDALVQALEDPRLGSTLVVVTADHGEGLGQHGWLEHALYLYDEQIRVPLIAYWPGQLPKGLRVATPVGLADVAPTLAELAGLPELAGIDGRSLAATARGGVAPDARPLFGYRHLISEATGWDRGEKTSVRTDVWKYIRSTGNGPTREELYDLQKDPGELHDVHETQAERLAQLGSTLDAHLAAMPAARPEAGISEETKRALRALGYTE
jgi:arylsulfatase A-like enzyme